jgi:hypothetical protein
VRIAVIGGTGVHGGGLAFRWARAGFDVLIGSRQAERAASAAADLKQRLPGVSVSGKANDRAASEADFVVLAVPFAVHAETIRTLHPALGSSIVIDTCVPFDHDRPGKLKPPHEGSALQEALHILGPKAKVVAAFQNVPAGALWELDGHPMGDCLVCGDDDEAKGLAMTLASSAGLRAIDIGPATNAHLAEAAAALVDLLNRRHRRNDIGVQFTLA